MIDQRHPLPGGTYVFPSFLLKLWIEVLADIARSIKRKTR